MASKAAEMIRAAAEANSKLAESAAKPSPSNSSEFGAEGVTDDQFVASMLDVPSKKKATAPARAAEQDTPDSDAREDDEGADGSNDDPSTGNSDEDGGDDGQSDAEDFDPFADPDDEQDAEDGSDDDDEGTKTYDVKVDGETKRVSLKDLIKNYSGEGAISKRLQEAAEARTAASAAKQQAEADAAALRTERATERDRLARAMGALKDLLAKPNVKEPDPNLQTTNPTKYLMDMEAFRQDQARVNAMHKLVDDAGAANNAAKAEDLQAIRVQESEKLLAKIPALRDPKKAEIVMRSIAEGAKSAGFTREEVAAAYDHRLFLMALKAQRYDQMVAAAKQGKEPDLTQRVGRAATTGTGSRTSSAPSRKREAQLFAKAKATGAVDDIAATLIVPQRRRG